MRTIAITSVVLLSSIVFAYGTPKESAGSSSHRATENLSQRISFCENQANVYYLNILEGGIGSPAAFNAARARARTWYSDRRDAFINNCEKFGALEPQRDRPVRKHHAKALQ